MSDKPSDLERFVERLSVEAWAISSQKTSPLLEAAAEMLDHVRQVCEATVKDEGHDAGRRNFAEQLLDRIETEAGMVTPPRRKGLDRLPNSGTLQTGEQRE